MPTSGEPVSIDPPGLTLPLLAERISHERDLREQAAAFLEEALRVQTLEHERRMDALNHANERAADLQSKTVSREVYDLHLRESASHLELMLDGIAKRLDAMEALADRREGALSTWRFIAGFLGVSGVVGVILGLFAIFGPR